MSKKGNWQLEERAFPKELGREFPKRLKQSGKPPNNSKGNARKLEVSQLWWGKAINLFWRGCNSLCVLTHLCNI